MRPRSSLTTFYFGGTLLKEASEKNIFTRLTCRQNEVSYKWDEVKQGLFTHYLLEGLKRKAVEKCGCITIFNLAKYEKRSFNLGSELS